MRKKFFQENESFHKGIGFLIKGMPEFQRRKIGFFHFSHLFERHYGMFKFVFAAHEINI